MSAAGQGTTPVVWTIAGFDPSNGAGVTADLRVFAAHGLFGASAITALTVQSTQGVAAVEPVSADTLRHTLNHLAADLPPAGIKIGMLGSGEAVKVVAEFLREMSDNGQGEFPVLLDPVLRSSSGAELLDCEGLKALQEELLPLATWITPNWAELGVLAGLRVQSMQEARTAMEGLGHRYPELQIVSTGGDQPSTPVDLWQSAAGEVREFRGERVDTTSTHGTGCAFSSALLSRLVLGDVPEAAVTGAKRYVEEALRHAPGVGRGCGPLGLLWPLQQKA